MHGALLQPELLQIFPDHLRVINTLLNGAQYQFYDEMMLVLKCVAHFLVTRKKEHESHEPRTRKLLGPTLS